MTRRRDASFTKNNEWPDRLWPVATKSLLADHQKLEHNHEPAEINQPLFALIKARKAVNDAMIACAYARRLNSNLPKTVRRLDSLVRSLRTAHDRFPLSVA